MLYVGLACITYLPKLHIIHKRIGRLIFGKLKYYPSHELFKELDILFDIWYKQMLFGYVLLQI